MVEYIIHRNESAMHTTPLHRGAWEELRHLLSSRLISNGSLMSSDEIHRNVIEAIQDMNLDATASILLREKYEAFLSLPYPFRVLLETGGYMDSIPMDLLEGLVKCPEDELYRALDEQISLAERKQARKSGDKRPADCPDGAFRLLDAPISDFWSSSTPSRLLKEVLKANGMTWNPSINQWVERIETLDEQGHIRQTTLKFLHNGEVSPRYYSSRESNIIQRCRYLGSADRWLEVQLIQEVPKRLEALSKGFVLFGRFYELGWHKFERKGSFPRLFFFATRALGPQPLPELPNMKLCSDNVLWAARDLYGRSCRYIAPSKLPARLELLWSKSCDVPLDMSTRILYADDLYGDNLLNLGESSSLMTDGAGLVSMDIAMRVPIVSSGVVSDVDQRSRSSVIQVRIWDDRCIAPIGIKGCLIPTPALPPNTILVTRSMVKSPNAAWSCREQMSLTAWLLPQPVALPLLPGIKAKEINQSLKASKICLFNGPSISLGVTTSTWVVKSPSRVNRTVLLLLDREYDPLMNMESEAGRRSVAIRTFFSRLMNEETMDLRRLKTSLEGAVKAANSVGGPQGDAVLRYLASGCHERVDEKGVAAPGFCPCLQGMAMLHKLEDTRIERLKKMNLETPETAMGVGVPDFSCSIPFGCIVVIDRDGRPLFGETTRKVLIYRHPCLGQGELVACRSVAPTAEFYQTFGASPPSAVYFSVLGKQSVAMKLATGDFDGDEYLVIVAREVVDNFKPDPDSDFVEMADGKALVGVQPMDCFRPRTSLGNNTPAGAFPPAPQPFTAASKRQTRSMSQEQSNQRIVPTAAASISSHQATKTLSDIAEVTDILVKAIHRESKAHNIVSASKIRWDSYADADGVRSPGCKILAKCYADSLDAVKSGAEIKELKNLPNEIPLSRSALAHWKPVWEQTGTILRHNGAVSIAEELFFIFHQDRDNEYWKDPRLLEPDYDLRLSGEQYSLLSKEDKVLFETYLGDWRKLKVQWGASWQDTGMGSPGDRRSKASVSKVAAIRRDRSQAIIEPHRAYLWKGVEPCPLTGQYPNALYWKAIALYSLCYDGAAKCQEQILGQNSCRNKRPTVYFVWQVAGDVLRHIKAFKRAGRQAPQVIPEVFCRGSGLRVAYRLGRDSTGEGSMYAEEECDEDNEYDDADDMDL